MRVNSHASKHHTDSGPRVRAEPVDRHDGAATGRGHGYLGFLELVERDRDGVDIKTGRRHARGACRDCSHDDGLGRLCRTLADVIYTPLVAAVGVVGQSDRAHGGMAAGSGSGKLETSSIHASDRSFLERSLFLYLRVTASPPL